MRKTAWKVSPAAITVSVSALVALTLGCGLFTSPDSTDGDLGSARLSPLPAADTVAGAPTGESPLGLAVGRDALLYVPANYDSRSPMPLLVLLHGSGGTAANILDAHRDVADTLGVILLAVDSRAYTWDAIIARFWRDITYMNDALAFVLTRYAVDRSHLGLGGFSDGATYALALGRANGDIFTHLIAHSPGYLLHVRNVRRPRIFIAHGTQDEILPYEYTRQEIVPKLRRADFPVRFESWDGPHALSRTQISAAMRWFVAP